MAWTGFFGRLTQPTNPRTVALMQGRPLPAPNYLTPYEPTYAERLGQAAQRGLERVGVPRRTANTIGNRVTSGVGFTPVVGDVTGAQESGRMIGEGVRQKNYVKAGIGAGTGILGMLPFMPSFGGMFIGKNARNWDTIAEKKFLELENAGIPREDIWRETMTMRGPDKLLRQEISDKDAYLSDKALGASMNAGQYRGKDLQTNYSGAINHPELAKNYWMYEDVNLGNYPANEGAYNSADERITVKAKSPLDALDILLHETQHGVQKREGFARGGNVSSALDDSVADINRELSAISKQLDALRQRKNFNPNDADLNSSIGELEAAYNQMLDDRSQLSQGNNAFQLYDRLFGEVEARNTTKRRAFDIEQRRNITPWETQEYPESEHIIRFNK